MTLRRSVLQNRWIEWMDMLLVLLHEIIWFILFHFSLPYRWNVVDSRDRKSSPTRHCPSTIRVTNRILKTEPPTIVTHTHGLTGMKLPSQLHTCA